MASSPIALAKERARQEVTGDDKFFKKLIYYFELRVPSDIMSGVGAGFQASFLFPFMLNPKMIKMSEPFTVELTPTQGGGLFVEENGIIMREITITGDTGFKPRNLKGSPGFVLSALKTEKRSFGRELSPYVYAALSGQKHFQYLQDAVFRTYADLKRDPETAEKTQLIFHNPRDDEHWLVVPREFSGERTSDKPVHYPYTIQLTAVDIAEELNADFSEDKGLLDQLKDVIRQVKQAIDLVQGAINDITAIVDEIERFVKDVGKIIDAVGDVIGAATDFVEGAKDLIESPLGVLDSVSGLVDDSMELVEAVDAAGDAAASLPDNVRQKFRQIGDGLDRIASYPLAFERSAAARMRLLKQQQELLASVSRDRQNEALETSPPNTLEATRNLGTTVTQGDAISARGTIAVGRGVEAYTSTREISIAQGDTLTSLAAKHLGDARLWQHIAVTNGMKPPFLNEIADVSLADEDVLPGTLTIGDKILIPNFARPPEQQPLLPILGVRVDEPPENRFLGTDFKLADVSSRPGAPVFDWEVDVEGGSTDAKHVSGIDNVSQGLLTRLSTERGTNKLYTNMGLERVVGTNFIGVDLEMGQFRIIQCVSADPRVAAVRGVRFYPGPDDGLISEMDVELRGFGELSTIRMTGL